MIQNEYYSQTSQGPYEFFEIENFKLESGGTLAPCKIAYATHGELNKAKDNMILFPHMFSGTSKSLEAYVGSGKALDPEKYFIVFPNQIGNGVSTSPHNIEDDSLSMSKFPDITIGDDVRAQHALVTEKFGVKELALVLGWSMGAQQTFEWAVRYPDMVKRAAPIAGTAKTSDHNKVMVEGLMRSLQTDPAFNGGDYKNSSDLEQGLRHLARMFAAIGVSREFYDNEEWANANFESLEQFMTDFWEGWFQPMDANALLCMLSKWQRADVSLHTNGDLAAALKRIKATVHNMPFELDMMFTEPECKADSDMINGCQHKPIPTPWGHFGTFGVSPDDFVFIDKQIGELLDSPAPK